MILSLIVSTIIVFFFFFFPVTDFDIWWHMAGGKFMIENWQFPYNDTFSYTAEGLPWNPNSWGFTALSYLGYKALGLDGLNIIKAIVSTLIFATVAGYLHWKKLLNYFSLAFVTLAFFAIREGFSLRPHTFAYFIFILFLIQLYEYKERRSYKLIVSLALTQFIWVNFHASFIFGLALGGIFFMSEFMDNLIRTKKIKIDRKDAVLMMSLFISSLLHVFYGYGYLVRIVSNYFSPGAQLPIRETLRATPENFLSLEGLVILLGLVTIGYFAFRTKNIQLPLTALFITVLAINTSRFMRDLILLLAITAPLYFFIFVQEFARVPQFKKLRARIKKSPSFNYVAPASFLILLFVLFLLARPHAGLGVSKFSYPIKAVEFIQEQTLLETSGGQLYNTYNFGGYLMWANQPHKVAMDGRARPYLGEPFGRYWLNFEGGEMWQDSVERYHITVALMTLPHISGGTVYNTSAPMFPREEWALVYYDDIGMVYVKRIEAFENVIEQYEYITLNPQAMDFIYLSEYINTQETFEEVLAELSRGLSLNPNSYRLHFTLAYVYGLAGLQEQMVEELNRTLEINPRLGAAKNVLESL